MQSSLAVVLGSLLGSHNERGQTGERLRHLQKLMLGEEKGEREKEGRGGKGREMMGEEEEKQRRRKRREGIEVEKRKKYFSSLYKTQHLQQQRG